MAKKFSSVERHTMTGAGGKFKMTIFEKDLGISKVIEESKKLKKKPYVKVGGLESSGRKKSKDAATGAEFSSLKAPTVADIATIHEYGAPSRNIPSRSFIRSTVDENQRAYDMNIAILRDEIFDGGSDTTVESALGILGMTIQRDIKAKFRDNDWQPLAESTVRKKNRRVIEKAEATINKLEKTLNEKGKLTKAQLAAENKASDTILTGGKSTPLIDTGQLRNSIQYKVEMDGKE